MVTSNNDDISKNINIKVIMDKNYNSINDE